MAKQIQWINTKEHNPFLAKRYKRNLDSTIEDMIYSTLELLSSSKTNKEEVSTPTETALLSSEIISLESTGIPQGFDQLYEPGPQAETFLFWGSQHIEYIDGQYVYMSIFAVPGGEVVYHVVPTGKIATVTRIQCYNTINKEVTISFFVGLDPFQNPRLRSDVLIASLENYDLSCSLEATEGESLGMMVSDENSVRVAISGHLNDVVIP